MQVERIHSLHSSVYSKDAPERVVREEKKTFTGEAVAFEGGKREPKKDGTEEQKKKAEDTAANLQSQITLEKHVITDSGIDVVA